MLIEVSDMKVDYKVDNIRFENLMGQIVIPRFQRGQVWVETKRKEFIRAILNGYPFGSLLLYKNEQSIESKYSLIDGLQRYSTLKKFWDSPSDYIAPSEFCKNEIKKISEICKKSKILISISDAEKEIKTAIDNEFKFTKEPSSIVVDVMKRLPFIQGTEKLLEIQSIIFQLTTSLFQKLNIMDLPIPVVIYNGGFNKLPDIFENVNSSGTKLTRYDMYAARWSDYLISVENKEVLMAVEDKYKKAMDDTDSEIEGFSENDILINKQINLFEFCFAVGKVLKDKYPIMFGGFTKRVGKSKDKDEVEAVGFSLLAAILNNNPRNPDGLHRYLCGDNAINTENLLNAIEKAVKLSQDILQKYVTDFKDTYVGKYSEYQTISLVATAFKIKFSINDNHIEENTSIKPLLDKFKVNAPLRFLYDGIIDFWSGTDGSRVGDELKKDLQYNRYIIPVSEDEWNVALSSWMGEQCNKSMRQKDKNTNLFINYILKLSGYSPKPNEKLEVDLIIPKKRFVSVLKDKPGLSAIGNIALIPEFENRSKREKTLYEQQDKKVSLYVLDEDRLNKLLYPMEDEISFISSPDTFTYERYLRFIKDRHLYLQRKFMELIKTL